MTPPIDSVTLAGTVLDLGTVDWAVTVSHGRGDVTAAPEPASAQVVTYQTGTGIVGDIGDELVIEAYGVPRFTGTVTDMAIQHLDGTDGQPVALVTMLATGPLARLGLLTDGGSGFIEETIEDRVAGILDATGLTYTTRPDPDMLLLAKDPAVSSVLSILGTLCQETGATMADTPAGSIMFESYTRRGYDYNPATWGFIAGDWSANAQAWSSSTAPATAAPTPVTIGGTGVLWEPRWANSLASVINDVTVSYGASDPQDTVNATDSASITRHGRRAIPLTTSIVEEAEAITRAGAIITAQSVARWDLQQIEVLVDELDTDLRDDVLALVNGGRVLVTGLPQPAPMEDFLGVVEGWTETYTPAGHSLVLSLSDPRYSYAMCEWIAVPPALEWGDVASVAWFDVILPADLT